MIDGEAEMSNKESVADLVATEYVKQMAGEAGEGGSLRGVHDMSAGEAREG